MPKYLVVAKNFDQCLAWMAEQGVAKSEVKYLTHALDINLAEIAAAESPPILIALPEHEWRKGKLFLKRLAELRQKLRDKAHGRTTN